MSAFKAFVAQLSGESIRLSASKGEQMVQQFGETAKLLGASAPVIMGLPTSSVFLVSPAASENLYNKGASARGACGSDSARMVSSELS